MEASSSSAKVKFRLNERQKLLMPLVMIGAFFEGFDFMVINLALPFITRDFQLNDQTASFTLSAVAVGTLLAFFVVRLADRWGRRPIFLWSVILYSFLSLIATANIEFFIACSFCPCLLSSLLGGRFYLHDQFDPNERASHRIIQSAARGAIFPSLLLPVTAMFNMEWQGLYVIGALPLILVIFFAKNLPETKAFLESRENLKNGTEHKPSLFAIFAKPYRKHIIAIMGIWVCMYLCYSSAMNFFSYHVVNDLGWGTTQVSLVTALAFTLGLSG